MGSRGRDSLDLRRQVNPLESKSVFVGTYERSVDGKGRIALPARVRSTLGETAYVALLGDRLALYSSSGFEEAVARLNERVREGELSQNRVRFFGANARPVNVDKQGRVTLPPKLRNAAEINDDVTLIGAFDRLEIYNPAVWTDFEENSPESDLSEGDWL